MEILPLQELGVGGVFKNWKVKTPCGDPNQKLGAKSCLIVKAGQGHYPREGLLSTTLGHALGVESKAASCSSLKGTSPRVVLFSSVLTRTEPTRNVARPGRAAAVIGKRLVSHSLGRDAFWLQKEVKLDRFAKQGPGSYSRRWPFPVKCSVNYPCGQEWFLLSSY